LQEALVETPSPSPEVMTPAIRSIDMSPFLFSHFSSSTAPNNCSLRRRSVFFSRFHRSLSSMLASITDLRNIRLLPSAASMTSLPLLRFFPETNSRPLLSHILLSVDRSLDFVHDCIRPTLLIDLRKPTPLACSWSPAKITPGM